MELTEFFNQQNLQLTMIIKYIIFNYSHMRKNSKENARFQFCFVLNGIADG